MYKQASKLNSKGRDFKNWTYKGQNFKGQINFKDQNFRDQVNFKDQNLTDNKKL